MNTSPPWYVLTGAPSSGKSTLLNELAGRGYRTLKEAARHVIEKEVAAGRDFEQLRADAAEFQNQVLRTKLAWEAELPRDEVLFLDRGIPDSVAYYLHEQVPEERRLDEALAPWRYRKVFILDLISPENLVLDGARSETWEDALALDRLLEDSYRGLGYEIVRVPGVSVSERADLILANL